MTIREESNMLVARNESGTVLASASIYNRGKRAMSATRREVEQLARQVAAGSHAARCDQQESNLSRLQRTT